MSEISDRYASRLADDEEGRARQLEGHSEVRQAFTDLETTLRKFLPRGRYRYLTITALEEAAMWANKSVASEYPVVLAHREGRQSEGVPVEKEKLEGLRQEFLEKQRAVPETQFRQEREGNFPTDVPEPLENPGNWDGR